MADNEIKDLKKERKKLKTRLTKIQTYVINQFVPNEHHIEEIKTRNTTLEDVWAKIDDAQSSLQDLQPDEHDAYRDEIEEQYMTIKVAINKILNEQKELNSNLNVTLNRSEQSVTEQRKPTINLPVLKIPYFDGRYEEWRAFYDVFTAVIDANTSLSNVEKLFYLRASIKGEAFKIIDSIPVSGDNYTVTLESLVERYDNPQFIINAHIKSLFDLPNVNTDAASSIRTLITETKQHLRALETLNMPTEHWDSLIVYILTQKLDQGTRRAWELQKCTSRMPTLQELYKFLETRCISLETMTCSERAAYKPRRSGATFVSTAERNNYMACRLCNERHYLYFCKKFGELTHEEKLKTIRDSKACFNCLRPGHSGKQCTSQGCRECNRRHHTLIHPKEQPSRKQRDKSPEENANNASAVQESVTRTLYNPDRDMQIMLSTAQVMVKGRNDNWVQCRVLLDNASQSNFITRKQVQSMRLTGYDKVVPINGIDKTKARTTKAVQLVVSSRTSKFQKKLEFLILDDIACDLPTQFVQKNVFKLPKDIHLADPTFNVPGEIQMLIGGELFFEILGNERHLLGKELPYIQNTALGWIVSGKVRSSNCNLSINALVTTSDLNESLTRFWNIEHSYSEKRSALSLEEKKCEDHFKQTTFRNSDGRYVVTMPLKEDPQTLGNSRREALQRLEQLEKRFKRNPMLKNEYTNFMNEYEKLNHMERVKQHDKGDDDVGYFIPHHPVFKENDITKIRVVFDASMCTDTGRSLNSISMIGPTVQQELFCIMLRFRTHIVAFMADIKKMYRQILIVDNQRKLQKILWKKTEEDAVQEHQLRTVTYGTTSAPYLATRCIHQLTLDEEKSYPLAAKRLRADMYVDDVMTGAKCISEALQLQQQIIELLSSACFELHKWCANKRELLENVKEHKKQLPTQIGNEEVKSLGLLWSPESDMLRIAIAKDKLSPKAITKRSVLSAIASVFDPIGLLGPVTLKAKLIMQDLWKLKVTWDETLDPLLLPDWLEWRKQLEEMEDFQIDRCLIGVEDAQRVEIHGFSDASQLAYGAVLYLRAENTKGEVSSRLICSKSRVAPIKEISLPRLELCGAHILAKLVHKVIPALEMNIARVHLWTDSSIVLAWLNETPSKWTTFVANRVSEIQELTMNFEWKHITSEHNPADHISRGLLMNQLKTKQLWWNGPTWLLTDERNWPISNVNIQQTNLLEQRSKGTVCLSTINPIKIFDRYSKLTKLIRVFAYCRRYLRNLNKNKEKEHGLLTPLELHEALQYLIKIAQGDTFSEELNAIRKKRKLPAASKLHSLTPFVDDFGLLRVGGRIENSLVPYDQKHPIILPEKHNLTKLLLEHEHLRLLHAGQQAVLTNIRLKYWILNAKSEIRKVIHKCVRCFRFRARGAQQMMAALPKERVQPARAFVNVGVDYGGPIVLKSGQRRNSPLQKGYIALFVCLCTRAIHLEAVTSLSTEAFIASLKRFISRRGKPQKIFSDNGTNFKGANHELNKLYKMFKNQETRTHIIATLSDEGILWKFIPSNAPHHGGIWEAGIKAAKHHLKRQIGTIPLTYEEFSTVLAEIEACLNSRPLLPMTCDPSDYTILTPSHFLTGDVLTSVLAPDLTELPTNRLSRWQLLERLKQMFWKTWSREYLSNLQQRHKWQTNLPNLNEGILVLIKEDNVPPLHWSLARIKKLHHGPDGRVRVATIITPRGAELQRPIVKLCPLPSNDPIEDDASRRAGCSVSASEK